MRAGDGRMVVADVYNLGDELESEGCVDGTVIIGVIGDFDGRASHVATMEAIGHAAEALGIEAEVHWLPTPFLLALEAERALSLCDGLWAAPGSPYDSLEGALAGIRFARERDWPFTGT